VIKYVPGMSDQNQPILSLDEELDVLEAVYKVGKDKGLELLRPEQLKKLRDAGRMRKAAGGTKHLSEEEALDASKSIVKKMIFQIDSLCRRIYGNIWEDIDRAKKVSIAQHEFEKHFGANPMDFGMLIFKTLAGRA
jgi:hypothetical protein